MFSRIQDLKVTIEALNQEGKLKQSANISAEKISTGNLAQNF